MMKILFGENKTTQTDHQTIYGSTTSVTNKPTPVTHLSSFPTQLAEVVDHLGPELAGDVFVEPPTLVCGGDVVPDQPRPLQVLLTHTAVVGSAVT